MLRMVTVDSKKLQHGCGRVYAGSSFFGLGLEDSHVPSFLSFLSWRASWTFSGCMSHVQHSLPKERKRMQED